jgi:uncharacterized protein YlxW (UPF0749 family)
MKQVIALTVVGLAVGFIIATCIIESHKYTTASTSYILDLRKQVDSLQTELFIKQTQIGRYEIALEIFKEEDSVAADHFEYILSTQAE